MNAALDRSLPVSSKAQQTLPRGHGEMPAQGDSFKQVLSGAANAAADGSKARGGDAAAEEPGWTSMRWAPPQAFDGSDRDAGEDGVEADEAAASTPSTNEEQEAAAPPLPATEPVASGEPVPPEDVTDTGSPIDSAAAPATPPESAIAPGRAMQEHGRGDSGPPAHPLPQASERAAASSALHRPPAQRHEPPAHQAAIPNNPPERENHGSSVRLDDVAGTARQEVKAGPPLPDGGDREPHADIRVLSIQRTPTPGPVGEQGTGAAQKSAVAEHVQTQLPAQSVAGRVLHTLKIEIHPAELGPVTARLRMVADQLTVDLQVETAEARHRLNTDSEAIVKALRSLGYDIDRVSVQQTAAGANGNAAGMRDGSGQPAADHSARDHSGDADRGHPQGRRDGGAAATGDNADVAENGLYI
ncbi:flagellar hook-length control protein FliK [Nitratireductor sp. ZSWI3]|uniref:flagellar hook-length control protein FliK n=1 Tax=Nitratireductor sp. ZSWI3 TaxID=2966359 RepID=UPI00214FA309|nr:flagellar hook-length control protein FliK [Nitratireductor sp. ZSWI3]MCR4264801.1 flagellar hook-length control protein FliK [Nitratireductor sp. ZSWI3]